MHRVMTKTYGNVVGCSIICSSSLVNGEDKKPSILTKSNGKCDGYVIVLYYRFSNL